MHLRIPASRTLRALMTASVASALATAGLLTVGASGAAAASNISFGKTAWATSSEGADFTPSKAVDGNTTTRWASQPSDAQTITIDLGSTASVENVVLQWESAYAKAFEVQLSDTAESGYSTVATVSDGAGGTQTLPAAGSARFVRLKLDQRATGYGYSLFEFQVFGSGGTTPPSNT